MWIESTKLKGEIFFEIFAVFCVPLVYGQAANCHVVVMIKKIKMASNWFTHMGVFFFS